VLYIEIKQDVCMIKRTTIEIDQDLLHRAKEALGEPTTRGTVEEALRRAAESVEAERARRAARQRRYLEELGSRADLGVLASEQMWR
jgi:Arc/MetJ family transcription regulator